FTAAANAAFACDDAPPSLALRDAIYSHDIDRVQALADENQTLLESGQRTAEDTRCLFRHFTKLRPETFELVDEWLKSHPDSPYAHTAKAWVDYSVSWQIRGERTARETYPAALSKFDELQQEAREHAELAYRNRPRLIAASDAVIKLAMTRRQTQRRDLVLREVMATDANAGTLERAVATVVRGWGGTWEEGAAMCDTYAQRVPDAVPNAATRCKLPLARGFKEQWDWMNETLATGNYPDFDYLRLDFILIPEASRDVAEIAYRVLSDEKYDLSRHTTDYDVLALKYGLPLMTETISRRRHAKAERELEQSPFSLAVLKMLGEPLLTSAEGDDGQLTISVLERPTPQQVLDYARRAVQASPYSPDAWTDLHTFMAQDGKITNVSLSEPYRVNAIVYDNHSPARLSDYMLQKLFEYDAFQRVKAGTLPTESMSMFDGIEEADDLICPVVRANRLLEGVCDALYRPGCDLDPGMESAVAMLEEKAKAEDICLKERTRPLAELAFAPMPLPDEK
ncbi:MAG: hypothetical protein IT533_06080, partial [Hyphomicrobiales bacterium]|nr:hypothetical protein [Hyphomicrobiales bacterium]